MPLKSFNSGWISYTHKMSLVKLFKLALNSSESGHKIANTILQRDINDVKSHINTISC